MPDVLLKRLWRGDGRKMEIWASGDCVWGPPSLLEPTLPVAMLNPSSLPAAAGWRPPVRDDPAWARQYLQVMFGVPTRVSGWKITNIGNRAVTEIALEASNDGNVFSRKFEVNARLNRAYHRCDEI